MKREGIIFLIFLSFIACRSSWDTVRETQLTTQPKKIELFVNQQTDPYTIRVDYTLHIPAGLIPKRGQLIYTPRLIASGYEYSLSPSVIAGEKYSFPLQTPLQQEISRIHHYQSKGQPLDIKINETIPFELWMLQSRLVATIQLKEGRRSVTLPSQTLAEGVIYIPQGPGPVRVKYMEKRIPVLHKDSVTFYYPTNVSYLQAEYVDNAVQLKQFQDILYKISQDTSAVPGKMVITAFCSPSGSLAYNRQLAEKRATNLLHYLQTNENLSPFRIELQTVPEDWQGLEDLLQEVPVTEKSDILFILRDKKEDDQKEASLRRLSSYKFLLEKVFPRLQKVICEIDYTTYKIQTIVVPE